MTSVRALFVGLTLAFSFVGHGTESAKAQASARPIVILVSIDGWRWDYLQLFAPPTLSRLASRGIRAEGLIPVFPSKTFPNHYSIVTGQYPARHGILSNNLVDDALPGRFSLSQRDRWVQQDTRWWGGEPIWVTAERQGQRTGTMFWPGSDVEIGGRRPSNWRMFDNDLSNQQRVDQVLAWMNVPEVTRPTFLTLYFSDVDSAAHDFGPQSEENRKAVAQVDNAVSRLMAGVESLGLAGRTNLILVSDHGMAPLSKDRLIVLDDLLDVKTVDVVDISPIVGLNSRVGDPGAAFRALKDKISSLAVYTRDTLPTEYRLRGHPRLAEVIGIADDGWHVTTRDWLDRESGRFPGGNHGYDPKHRSMHGLFVAVGPQLKSGVVVPAFENVHVYELMCKILGLRAASNDGDAAVTESFLRETANTSK
jgi:predicted AlkP superfamily pyrophosphatase or phosphodiesterase